MMRYYCSFLIGLIFLLALCIGCRTPSKTIASHITEIEQDIPWIASGLMAEYPKSRKDIAPVMINSKALRDKLVKLGNPQIDILYNVPIQETKQMGPATLTNSYDSTMVFTWNKSVGENDVRSESLIYFFSAKKPAHKERNDEDHIEKRINDSLWYQKDILKIVTVY